MIISVLCLLSAVALIYIYQGYAVVLNFLPKGKPLQSVDPELPKVTLLLTVYNEEAIIEEKIANSLALDYPAEKLEILVASDGSTDRTDELVKAVTDARVRLFRPDNPNGKTDTQNKAIATATGDILVFTDAEARLETDFLRALVKPYADPSVGGVCGELYFENAEGTGIGKNQGFYWNYELKLRRRESERGLLAVASGACMSLRMSLFKPMQAIYGEDCIIPLSVVTQGYRYIHCHEAKAVDRMPNTQKGEFKARVRMTLRNWTGTWAYSHLLNPLKNPGYAFALWSHKLLRWLSPVFLLAFTITACLLPLVNLFLAVVPLGLFAFYLMALVGWMAERGGFKVPLVHIAYSFILANLGFMVGLWRGIRGQTVTRYHNAG